MTEETPPLVEKKYAPVEEKRTEQRLKATPTPKPEGYDIVEAVKNQPANITVGELLQDNPTYKKQLRTLLTGKRRKRKLPSVEAMRLEWDDKGPPEIEVQIMGCVLTDVPVDGGSSVNIVTEETAFNIGFSKFEKTQQVLRMADQSRVIPVGKLIGVATVIGGLAV